MSIRVIEANVGDRNGVITLEADSQEDVASPKARDFAIKQAVANGLSKPGLSGTDAPYPVDHAGKILEFEKVLKGESQAAAFRCDYRVTGML
jgi:hypothetical protein